MWRDNELVGYDGTQHLALGAVKRPTPVNIGLLRFLEETQVCAKPQITWEPG